MLAVALHLCLIPICHFFHACFIFPSFFPLVLSTASSCSTSNLSLISFRGSTAFPYHPKVLGLIRDSPGCRLTVSPPSAYIYGLPYLSHWWSCDTLAHIRLSHFFLLCVRGSCLLLLTAHHLPPCSTSTFSGPVFWGFYFALRLASHSFSQPS